MSNWLCIFGTMVVLATACAAIGEVRLAGIFSDNMVLQRDMPIRVWGWAAPGDVIKVTLASKEVSTKAAATGRWLVELPAMKDGENLELTVTGPNTIVLKNLIIGDVWLCSGQSNMSMALGACDSADDVKTADFPKIRWAKVSAVTSPVPEDDVTLAVLRRGDGKPTAPTWQVCTPVTAGSLLVPAKGEFGDGGLTGTGFYFAREVHHQTGVPIGLIDDSWGGTPIEPWISPEGLAMTAGLADDPVNKAQTREAFRAGLPKKLEAWERWLAEARPAMGSGAVRWERWLADTRTKLEKGEEIRPTPALLYRPLQAGHPIGQFPQRTISWCCIYDAMIRPITQVPIKGVLWYQGEGAGNWNDYYYVRMQALINGWRKVWGQGNFPFYFVQLANIDKPNDDPAGEPRSGRVEVRSAQLKAFQTIPNTGMAMAIDVGDIQEHPTNKYDVGVRLARWALARDYGQKHLTVSGPIFREMKVENGRIRLWFDYVETRLIVGAKKGREPVVEDKQGKLQRFAIAGADKKWHWADAAIDGKTVVVSSPDVPAPVAVRYAFSVNPRGANLYNKEGLPASPFRTDNWPAP